MSSGVTLSSATRANLLSLQNTADLVSTTQQRLSTGKKVNSAIDNASSYFTAAGLSSRSDALSTLLDGISNGIQTIQAASQGITSIQSLTAQLKSTAQQALASSNSFTSKASSSATLTGALGGNLLSSGATTASGSALGSASEVSATKTAEAAFAVGGTTGTSSQTLTLTGTGTATISISATATVTDAEAAINAQSTVTGITASTSGSGASTKLVLTGPTDGSNFSYKAGSSNSDFGFTDTSTTATSNGTLDPAGTTLASALGFAANDTFTVNGASVTVGATDTLDSLSAKVSTATGGAVSAAFDSSTRKFTFTATDGATAVTLGNGSTATAKIANLGYSATSTFAAGLGATTNGSLTTLNALNGTNLTVKVGSGSTATQTTISFGTGASQVQTLDQLNAALGAANAQASIDSTGKLTITSTNEAGAEDLNLSGTATSSVFTGTSSSAVIGGDGSTTRNTLVTDYNNLLTQIDQLAGDAGFNGVNLLNGDTVKTIFNEKNTSSVSIKGVATNSASLGLSGLGDTDFQDATKINAVLDKISSANNTLESQAATYGTNLSVIQNRQSFSKGMINILDTGAANLTDADLNEEAANSQALTTRQSLGVSALSLANQAQQGVLQLLR